MAVVSISRQFGAGGRTLGQQVAKRLGYQFIDQAIIDRVAEKANVSAEWVESVEKEAGGRLMRIISGLVSSDFIERLLGESSCEACDFDEKKYVDFVGTVFKEISDQGEAVIIGRGSQVVLKDDPQVIRVLLIGDLEDRIRFMMNRHKLDRIGAERAIEIGERKRRALMGLFGVDDPDSPNLYQVVINTSQISLKWAEDIVCSMVGSVLDKFAKPIWD